MKKNFLIILILLLVFESNAQEKSKISHWSFTLETGINQFDGDMSQNYNSVIPNSEFKLSSGGSLEYTITPIWGLGLEFYYLPLSAKQSNYYFTSNLYHANAYLSINLLNLFSDEIDTRWGIWGTLGGGLGYYNSLFYSNTTQISAVKNGLAIIVPIGVNIEYNLTKSLAIGGKIQYRSHNKDNLEGNGEYNYSGVTNDFLSLGTLNLRWKINANSKNHVRNLNTKTFAPEEAMIPARQAKAKADSLQGKVDSLRNEMNVIKPKIEKIEMILENGVASKVDKTEPVETNDKPVVANPELTKPVENTGDDEDYDNDGVPNKRDKEPNTKANKAVNYWGVTIRGVNINGFGSVYFDFNKIDLDATAMKEIKLIAQKMNSDPTLLLEIRGFADNVGNVQYNQKLSQRRADIVKNVLINTFKVSADRIIANGKGKVIDMPGANRLNRRCNFYFNE